MKAAYDVTGLLAYQIARQRPEAWQRAARRLRCIICGAPRPRGHHVITQAELRKHVRDPEDYERLRWDRRNLLALCDEHHVAHHSRQRPVSIQELSAHAPGALVFADELGLRWWIERTYPDDS